MTDFFGKLAISLVGAYAIYWLSNQMGSTFIVDWLDDNILTVILALLAINIASIGVTASRLYDLKEKLNANFTRTAKSLRLSVWEQIGALAIALAAGTVKSSSSLQQQWPYTIDVANVVLIAVLIWSIWVLYDTTASILILLEQ